MKKCVQEGPVTPMAQEWWDTILTMIPERLVQSPWLQSHISELHAEVHKEYEASMKKSMGINIYIHYFVECSFLGNMNE